MGIFDFAKGVIDIVSAFNSSGQKCPDCGSELERDSDEEMWVCPNCGFEGYTSMLGGSAHIVSDDDDDYGSEDDIPEGCQACGGPYPNCKSSCSLFDD